ncbi:hypothetical protein THAOC_34832, partial [Thalassiosira oceanica]
MSPPSYEYLPTSAPRKKVAEEDVSRRLALDLSPLGPTVADGRASSIRIIVKTMRVIAAAAVASLAAVVLPPTAAFSSSDVGVSARRTRTTATTPALNQYATQAAGVVDVYDIYAPRDVYSMEEWAAQYGMQKAPGVEVASEDGVDYSLQATQPDLHGAVSGVRSCGHRPQQRLD